MNKLTTAELEELRDLQKNINNLTIELGSISIAEKEIEKRKDTANSMYKVIYDLQENFMKRIEEKYGKGTINIETGEINLYGTR
jgi:hypothetical protein